MTCPLWLALYVALALPVAVLVGKLLKRAARRYPLPEEADGRYGPPPIK